VIELRFPIPIDTIKGRGLAYFIDDCGIDHDLIWTVALDASGEFWSFRNRDVRAVTNWTMGRMANSLKTGSKITRKPSKMMTNAGGKAKPSRKGRKK
jgi:hypothetical protein